MGTAAVLVKEPTVTEVSSAFSWRDVPSLGWTLLQYERSRTLRQRAAHCCLLRNLVRVFLPPWIQALALTDMKDHDDALLCTYRAQPFLGKEMQKKQELWQISGLLGLTIILCASLKVISLPVPEWCLLLVLNWSHGSIHTPITNLQNGALWLW